MGQGKQFIQNIGMIRASQNIFCLAHMQHPQRNAVFLRNRMPLANQRGAVLLHGDAGQNTALFVHMLSFQALTQAPRALSWAVTVSISPIFQSGRGRLAS